MIVECLGETHDKPHKRHYLPLHRDLYDMLSGMRQKGKEDRSESPIINDGDSIIKEEENTTSEAQLFHGPLYCEECD